MMPEIAFCVICLRADRNLRTVEEALINFHDELCDFSLPIEKLVLYCFECEWNLRKFRKFKQQCVRADKVLQTWLSTGQDHHATFFQKFISHPTLTIWDGRNSKVYFYLFEQETDDQQATNDGMNLAKVNSCDYMINKNLPTAVETINTQVQLTTFTHLNSITDTFYSATAITDSNEVTSCTNNDDIKEDTDANIYDDEVWPLGDSNDTAHDPLALDDDNKDDIELIDDNVKDNGDGHDDNDVTNDTGLLSDIDSIGLMDLTDKDLHETVGTTDIENIIKYPVNKVVSNVNNKDTEFVANIVPDLKHKTLSSVEKIGLETKNNLYGLLPKTVINIAKETVHTASSNLSSKKPDLNTIRNWLPEPLRNINIHKVMFIRNGKQKYNDAKLMPQDKINDNSIVVNDEHCYSSNNICTDSNSTTFLNNKNDNDGENINMKNNNPESIQNNAHPKIKVYGGPKLVPRLRNINKGTLTKRLPCESYNKNSNTINTSKTLLYNNKNPGYITQIDEPTCQETERLCRVNTEKSLTPLQTQKSLKRISSYLQQVNNNQFKILVNGNIICRLKKYGENIKDPIKKNKLKAKKVVKQSTIKKYSTIKKPKLSKERRDYLNLLSFVKFDKKQPGKEVAEESSLSKKETLENDMKSQKNVEIEGNYLKSKVSDLGSQEKFEGGQIITYPNELNEKIEDEFKIDGTVFKYHTGSGDGNDQLRTFLTELANMDDGSGDDEIKLLYVYNSSKEINENNIDAQIFQIENNIIEFAPDVVANEEIVEYHEVHENVNNCDTTTNDVNNLDTTDTMDKEEQVNKETEEYKVIEENKHKEHKTDIFPGTLMKRKVYMKLRKLFKLFGEIKTADGNVVNKDCILNFYENLSNEDRWQLAEVVADTIRKSNAGFSSESAEIMWKLQQKCEIEYTSIFDIVYFNTEEKVLREFLQRRTCAGYVKAQYKCELCLKPFPNQKYLDYHNKWHEPSQGDLTCNLCEMRYKNKKQLDRHKKLHTIVYKCKLCPLITHRKSVMFTHSMNHKGHRRTCKICGQSYRCGTSYQHHLSLHSKSNECNMCARNFISDLGLAIHKRSKHPNEDVMQSPERTVCEVCNITYISQEVYMKHYRKVHDPAASKLRSVRTLGAEWRPRKDRADEKTSPKPRGRKRKYNFVDKPQVDAFGSKTRMIYNKPRPVSQTFAAATLAIQEARHRNMLRETLVSETEHIDAANSTSMERETNHNDSDDVNAARNMQLEKAPSYDEVTRAIKASGKTLAGQYHYEIPDKNNTEREDENIARDLPLLDATINATKRTIYREDRLNVDKVVRTSNTRALNIGPQYRTFKSSNQGNVKSRTEAPKLIHTVDAATHTITIKKRKPGLDMPQLIDTCDADEPSIGVTHGNISASGRNVKRGKKRPPTPDMPQVFDTMTCDNESITSRNVEGKILNIAQVLSRDNTKSSRHVKGGKRRPLGHEMSQDSAIMTVNTDAASVMNTEHDYYTSHFDATGYDTDSGSRRSMYAGKRRPKLPQFLDTRNRETEQEPAPSVETDDSERSSSRTIEAMSMHVTSSKSRTDMSLPSPDKKGKKVNVEMNPTYGYVYSTYHP